MVGIIFMEIMILRMTDDVLSVSTRVVHTLFICSTFFLLFCAPIVSLPRLCKSSTETECYFLIQNQFKLQKRN